MRPAWGRGGGRGRDRFGGLANGEMRPRPRDIEVESVFEVLHRLFVCGKVHLGCGV